MNNNYLTVSAGLVEDTITSIYKNESVIVDALVKIVNAHDCDVMDAPYLAH